eukprot:CAMPEP_0197597984 /NCGR_PEP_ID=MMETSP1326-20131121/28408_1 /TAXON_ID=1155430 /ORGANISM="Genus nov. species nov., Strain RCC2288" /LENGTH=155 /DNA_ID=CAMNT_0043164729 /DNA_START=202 /DNA_END=666 /DNA_ORIENTATION=-
MDLAAVARQRVVTAAAAEAAQTSASYNSRDYDSDSGSDDSDAPPHDLDSESAKALLRAYVKNSLDGVRHGQRAQYYELLEALTGLEDEAPAQDKLLMLEVLTENVSSMNEGLHEALLQRVLTTSLWRCSPEVVELLVAFCINLVVTHTGSLLQTC